MGWHATRVLMPDLWGFILYVKLFFITIYSHPVTFTAAAAAWGVLSLVETVCGVVCVALVVTESTCTS